MGLPLRVERSNEKTIKKHILDSNRVDRLVKYGYKGHGVGCTRAKGRTHHEARQEIRLMMI